jgi:guanylate kinase
LPVQSARITALIIAGPAGAGKNTVYRPLFTKTALPLARWISYTTRAPRTGEINGTDYHFVTVERFMELAEQGHFLEYKEVHGNWYGTPIQPVQDVSPGTILCKDMDIQGIDVAYEFFFQNGLGMRISYIFIDEETCKQRVGQRAAEKNEPVDQADLERRLVSLRRENAWAHKRASQWPKSILQIVDGAQSPEVVRAAIIKHCLGEYA